MVIQDFLERVQQVHATGNATEHSYRSAIEWLFHSLDGDIRALNEPKQIKVGAPDFQINRGDITIGHVEAKDIPVDIRNLKDANKAQQERYLKGLPNLVYTNCLDFDFYRDGEHVTSISIGGLDTGIQANPENFEALEHLLREFIAQRPQTIASTRRLARMMAGKALLIKDVLGKTLREDEKLQTELSNQYAIFKEDLIHDITPEDFADIYAETIAYGMFAARLHDDTVADFSRYEALERLPKTYPFLRNLFSYIAGPNLDDRIKWIIDELADVFQACDLHELMKDFGRLTGQKDPFLHFYEVFLQEYNPAKRRARGVWYTPEPVVNFIVRAVDEVLQTEFGLPLGLADTSKVTIDWDTGQPEMTKEGKPRKSGKNATVKREVHRVQILDPATGTGTFLAEVIKQIAPKVKDMAEGMWSGYVEKDLIPRLHGFELLMASYAMCHIKLDMVLTELGYKPTAEPPRMSVYLTNSLEEGEPANQSLPFAQWLSNEVKQANAIKRDMPIMVVIGNPPYSGISQNMGDWIVDLIEDYKYVDGKHFGERKHWLHDDYVKFIRLAEHMIEKNGEGVLGFVTNHGYLDNPTFRGMRWHLMQTFDEITVLNLHGNTNKKETSPDGSQDKNVFDIRQGVAIMVAIKRAAGAKQRRGGALVNHLDLWGDRASKYSHLWSLETRDKVFHRLQPEPPYFMFYPVDARALARYDHGFNVAEIFLENQKGIITARDRLAIDFNNNELEKKLERFADPKRSEADVRQEFFPGKKSDKYLPGDTRGWSLAAARDALGSASPVPTFTTIEYRPFDRRSVAYSETLVDWPRTDFMRHFIEGPNIGLSFNRGVEEQRPFTDAFVFTAIVQHHSLSNKEANNIAPLYLYPSEQELDQTRRVNFDEAIYARIREAAQNDAHGEPDELATFDYIYGVLHCPAYRETYAEFLKIDFPRIPYPPSPEVFWDVSEKGTQLRRLHLMELGAVGEAPYPYNGDGDNEVGKPSRDDEGRVWINKTQFFENVPEVAWEFFIGGYQPAQKWLKDRKGRELSFEDVLHYQRIVKVLSETDRIMKTIEMPLENGELANATSD